MLVRAVFLAIGGHPLMTEWFISDFHVDHKNLLRDGRIGIRPEFANVDQMFDYMIECVNRVVHPRDILWVLGDLTLERVDFTRAERFVRSLNGYAKHFIRGNHDRGTDADYHRMGFDTVTDSFLQDRLLFTHVPIHPSLFMPGVLEGCIHGHTHERNIMLAADPSARDWRYLNVSVEARNYTPISREDILAHFESVR